MSSREAWYDIHLITSAKADFTKEITYNSQASQISKALIGAGVSSTKVTHINRSSAARIAEANGADEMFIRRTGHWRGSCLENNYLTNLPKPAIRALAGFPVEGGGFFLPRASVSPGEHLQKQLFPEIEERLAALVTRTEAEQDTAAIGFCKLLTVFRSIILQDAAVLQPIYPNSAAWRHPVFASASFAEFQSLVAKAEQQQHLVSDLLLRSVAPQLSNVICSGFGGVISMIKTIDQNVQQIQHGKHQMDQSLPPTLQPPQLLQLSREVPATYVLSKRHTSVSSVWKEYAVGIDNEPPLRELEQIYGASWRRDSSLNRLFRRRMRIYKAVQAAACRWNVAEDIAAEALETERRASKTPLSVFACKIQEIAKTMSRQ